MKTPLHKIYVNALFLALCSMSFAQYVQPVRFLVMPKATGAVDINDLDDETFYSASQSMNAFNLAGCADYPSADFTSSFKVCYDDVNLYIFGSCIDDVDHSYTGVAGSNTYQFDNMEVFIDLDTNGSGILTAYDSNTVQLRINRNVTDSVTGGYGRAHKEDFKLMTESTGTGWSFELAIPWTAALGPGQLPIDIMQYLGRVCGFDVSGADSDGTDPEVGARDCQTAWDDDVAGSGAEEDGAWNNRSVFGIFGGGCCGPITVKELNDQKFVIFPNPTTNSLTIDQIKIGDQIEIINIYGQQLKHDVASSEKINIDISNLPKGNIFLVKITDSQGNTSTSKFIIE